MKTMADLGRFLFGVFAGLMAISLIAESIEFGLVALVNGAATANQETYFGIRNRTWFLGLKFLYNGLGLYAGGWLAGRIASRWRLQCVIVLAVVQTLAFVWGMTLSEFAGTTPTWAWVLYAIEIPILIWWGGRQERN
jgi:hypothetical protein